MPDVLPVDTPLDDEIVDAVDTVSGSVPESGFIPDLYQDPVTGGDAGVAEPLIWASGPLGFLLTSDPQGDSGGIADNLGEGLLSPGEQFNPEGLLESSVNFAFDDSNFNPEEDGGDTIDLPGPGAGEFFQDPGAALDPFGEHQQFALLIWGLVAVGVLWLVRPALELGNEVAG
jgi:hypothetical protein